MTDAPQRYPLQWPPHRDRKPASARRPPRFTSNGKAVTMAVAFDRLQAELDRVGGTYPILSSNVELRLDGRPRSGIGERHDPGVCVYFALKGKPFALACDTFTTVAGNVAALAAHIEALRVIERHGVASAADSLQAFQALPAPDGSSSPPSTPPARSWREVLGLAPDWPSGVEIQRASYVIQGRYRELASKAPPDVLGGSAEKMAALNAARDQARAFLLTLGKR